MSINNLCTYGTLIQNGNSVYLQCKIDNQSCWCTYYCGEICGLKHNKAYTECKNYKKGEQLMFENKKTESYDIKSVGAPEKIGIINKTDDEVLGTYTEEKCKVVWVKDKSFAIQYPFNDDFYGIEILCKNTSNIHIDDFIVVKIEGTFGKSDFKITYTE